MARPKGTFENPSLAQRVLLGTVTLLFAIVSLPILLVLAVPVLIWNEARQWSFRLSNRDRLFLICTRRHDWREVLVNNVFPVLPEGTVIVWVDDVATNPFPTQIRMRLAGLQKPFLLRILRKGIRVVDLHRRLLDFKTCRRADDRVRSRVDEELRTARETILAS